MGINLDLSLSESSQYLNPFPLGDSADWWQGKYSPNQAAYHFGRRVYLAASLTLADLHQTIPSRDRVNSQESNAVIDFALLSNCVEYSSSRLPEL